MMNHFSRWQMLVVAWCLILSLEALAKEPHVFVATVDEIVDGDSLVVFHEGNRISVRLEGIDAPEPTQEFGAEAKQALAKALPVKSKVVVVDLMRGKYGRVIGHVYRPEFSRDAVGLSLVKTGSAWHFARYNKSKIYQQAQVEARAKQLGLWKRGKAQSPFAYRVAQDQGEVADPTTVHKPTAAFEKTSMKPSPFWLNEKSNVRRRVDCQFADLTQGQPCKVGEGKPCPICFPGSTKLKSK